MKSIKELKKDLTSLCFASGLKYRNNKVNILALGDVGATLLLGLKLLGGEDETISEIGIFDVNENVMKRYEMEMNQMGMPFEENMPKVKTLTEESLFDCEMFVFCASKGVPPVGASGDVRMAQFEANRSLVTHYAKMASEKGFKGIFAVVSDPVDPLCKAALLESNLLPGQIRGYGLGVMNRRAMYFANKDNKFKSYLTEGRAFGPHGSDLVIANSIENYDDELSRELTELTVTANLKVRELGFKPFFAPAISSGAISLLLTLQGEWNYSSIWFGNDNLEGAFMGVKNRIDVDKAVFEDIMLADRLFDRIEKAYINLQKII